MLGGGRSILYVVKKTSWYVFCFVLSKVWFKNRRAKYRKRYNWYCKTNKFCHPLVQTHDSGVSCNHEYNSAYGAVCDETKTSLDSKIPLISIRPVAASLERPNFISGNGFDSNFSQSPSRHPYGCVDQYSSGFAKSLSRAKQLQYLNFKREQMTSLTHSFPPTYQQSNFTRTWWTVNTGWFILKY